MGCNRGLGLQSRSRELPLRRSSNLEQWSLPLAQGQLKRRRGALALHARGSADPGTRARLYGRIGEAEERRGNAGRAYDAYKIALGLNPEEPRARKRVREMERAAGLGDGAE